jgi:hypothetical protein
MKSAGRTGDRTSKAEGIITGFREIIIQQRQDKEGREVLWKPDEK